MADPKAMVHILSAANSYTYEKPSATRTLLKNALGEGVLVAEGDVHKRQRKILQPAFNVGAIRELNPTFMRYARELGEKIGKMIDISAQATRNDGEKNATTTAADGVNSPFSGQTSYALEVSQPGAPVLDMAFWVTRAALDIIGDAGFSHHFQALEVDIDPSIAKHRPTDALGIAFKELFGITMKITLPRIIQLYLSQVPGLGWIESLPTKRKRTTDAAYKKLEEVSMQIVDRKKKEIRGEMQAEVEARGKTPGKGMGGGGGFTKADFDEKESATNSTTGLAPGKDLLHLMMRANMAADVSPKEKLDDAELIGQITTLLMAGHETTSTQTSWTLWLMAALPQIQQKLRAEIHDHFGKGDG